MKKILSLLIDFFAIAWAVLGNYIVPNYFSWSNWKSYVWFFGPVVFSLLFALYARVSIKEKYNEIFTKNNL